MVLPNFRIALHVIAEASEWGCECGKVLREKQVEAPACQLGMSAGEQWVGCSDEESRETHPDNEEMNA